MLGGLIGIFGFDEGLEIVEAHGPEAAVVLEPGIDGAQGFGVEVIDSMPAFAMLADEMGAAEQAQMPGNSRPGHGKRLRDGSGGLAAAAQKIEHGAADGIGDGLEGGFPIGRICNRTVPHNM